MFFTTTSTTLLAYAFTSVRDVMRKYVTCNTTLLLISCSLLSYFSEKRGGPSWNVWLGRRDSLEASFSGANQFIPAPNSSLETLIANFKQQGLDIGDLVTLSGKTFFNEIIRLSNAGTHKDL